MKRKLLVILVIGLFLTLTIGAFSCVTANIVNEGIIASENDEGPCSIKITFMTHKGEEYVYDANFQLTLVFSIPNNKSYYARLEKESGSSSILIENLPWGLYHLYDFGFNAGYTRPIPKYVLVGSGDFIPSHRDVTIKMIDCSL